MLVLLGPLLAIDALNCAHRLFHSLYVSEDDTEITFGFSIRLSEEAAFSERRCNLFHRLLIDKHAPRLAHFLSLITRHQSTLIELASIQHIN